MMTRRGFLLMLGGAAGTIAGKRVGGEPVGASEAAAAVPDEVPPLRAHVRAVLDRLPSPAAAGARALEPGKSAGLRPRAPSLRLVETTEPPAEEPTWRMSVGDRISGRMAAVEPLDATVGRSVRPFGSQGYAASVTARLGEALGAAAEGAARLG